MDNKDNKETTGATGSPTPAGGDQGSKQQAVQPRVSTDAKAKQTTTTIELKQGQVLVGLKGNENESFITTKNEWDKFYSTAKVKGTDEPKFVLLDEKKS